jgi:hypothetical protein
MLLYKQHCHRERALALLTELCLCHDTCQSRNVGCFSVPGLLVQMGVVVLQVAELAKEDLNRTIMCVGHNRGWEEAASAFVHAPLHLQTANAALMQTEADTWEEAVREDVQWRLVGLVTAGEGLVSPGDAAARTPQPSTRLPNST